MFQDRCRWSVVGKYPPTASCVLRHRHRDRPRAVAVPQPDQVGMMIRAGVDDRGMLAASGVNVQLVFALTFAIGAGLAGFGRRRRRHGAVDLARRGHALPAGLAGRGDRRRHGQRPGRRPRRAPDRPGRAVRPRLRADLRRRLHLPDHGAGAGLPAAAASGPEPRMSAAQWRRAMNSGAGRTAWSRPAGAAATPGPAGAATATASAAEPRPSIAGALRPSACAMSPSCSPCWSIPGVATPFFTYQIGAPVAGARPDRAVAHLPRRLGRHGLAGADERSPASPATWSRSSAAAARQAAISLGWPWWLAVRSRVAIAALFATFVGWLSVRTEGIYTIMITLAIGVAFYYLAQQNYTVFNGFQGFSQVHAPVVLGVDWQQAGPVLLPCACSGRWPATSSSSTCCARRSASRCRASATIPRRMNALGFDVTAHRIAAYAVAGAPRRDRRRADDLVQRPHLARLGRTSAP